MSARGSHIAGWYLCLLAVVPGLAQAVDCPGYPNAWDTLPSWPTNQVPTTATVAGNPSGTNYCGAGTATHTAGGTGSTTYTSYGAAYAALISTNTADPLWIPDATCDGVQTGSSYRWYRQTFKKTSGSGCTVGSPCRKSAEVRYAYTSGTCTVPEEPDDCDALAGQTKQYSLEGTAADVDARFADPACVGTCAVESYTKMTLGICPPGAAPECGSGGISSWDVYVKYSGEDCGGSPPAEPDVDDGADKTPDEVPPLAENCATTGNGNEVCQGPYGENCGYVNDKYTCVPPQDDECWVDADGSRLCGQDAPMPPVPDSGTPGVPAEPDDVITKDGEEYDYYNPTTVGGSSRDPTDSGRNPNRPDSTDPATPTTPVHDVGGSGGGGGGDGDGYDPRDDASASGGTTCASAPACSGDPVGCAVLNQQWRARCVEVPSEGDLETALGPSGIGEDGTFTILQDEVDIPGAFDSSGDLGSTGCIDDLTIPLGGLFGSIEIPLSEMCWLLGFIGTLVMVSAYVAGARIVVGGI